MSGIRAPKPPSGLGPAGRDFWRRVCATWELDVAEVRLLEDCCHTVDTLAALQQAITTSGVMDIGSRKQDRVHPAVAEARAQRLTLARLLAALELPAEDGETMIPTPLTTRGRKGNAARWGKTAEVRRVNRGSSSS